MEKGEKLAIFLPSLAGGGAEKMLLNLAQDFVELGYNVDLILANAEGPYLKRVGQSVNLIDFNCRRMITSLPKLIKYLKREKPAAILTTLEFADILTIWAKIISRAKTNVVVRVPNNLIELAKNAGNLKNKLYPYFVRVFFPFADEIIAISKGVSKSTSELIKIPYEKINVIYNPAVTEEIKKLGSYPNVHPWFKEYPVILGVGRLTKQKNFSFLIKAFEKVRKEIPSKLLILGEGEERGKLQEKIKELGLTDDVELRGFEDNPYSYMKNAKVFVLSSKWEGFGNVLVESMAFGTQIISTDCESGPAEILENGKFGQLVKIDDVEELAIKIISSLKNDFKSTTIMERAEDFSIRNISLQYLDVLLRNHNNNRLM
jgi:glycosyltransferase involved in cell wall biosynthesis